MRLSYYIDTKFKKFTIFFRCILNTRWLHVILIKFKKQENFEIVINFSRLFHKRPKFKTWFNLIISDFFKCFIAQIFWDCLRIIIYGYYLFIITVNSRQFVLFLFLRFLKRLSWKPLFVQYHFLNVIIYPHYFEKIINDKSTRHDMHNSMTSPSFFLTNYIH